VKKADEYVQWFEKDGKTAASLSFVTLTLLSEVKELRRVRKTNDKNALLGIFEEIDAKFLSFQKKAKTLFDGTPIKKDEFRRVLRNNMPEKFEWWNIRRGGKLLLAA